MKIIDIMQYSTGGIAKLLMIKALALFIFCADASSSDAIILDQKGVSSPVQLNFFWVTGLPWNELRPEYGSNFTVPIGGKRDADFKKYVDLFLQKTSPQLSVNFICDQATYDSNLFFIRSMQSKLQNYLKKQVLRVVK
jgi:hypothetical protein